MGRKLNAFLIGVGSVVVIAPSTGSINRHLKTVSVEQRLFESFARAGSHIRNATGKVRDDSGHAAKRPAR